MEKFLCKNKGITLIALVITIIVLLILAGISVMMFTGENSIIRKAGDVQEKTGIAENVEKLDLALEGALVKGNGKYTEDVLKEVLNNELGEDMYEIENIQNGWKIKYGNEIRKVMSTGEVVIVSNENSEGEGIDSGELTSPSEYKDKHDISKNNDGSVWAYLLKNEEDVIIIGHGEMKNFASYPSPGNEASAFIGDSKIKKVSIGSGVINIGDNLFSACTSISNVILSDSVTTIAGSAFSGCTSLTNIIIPNSVTTIAGSAFSGCTSLTNITIPNSVTTIGNYAFYDTGITEDMIPNTVTSIGYRAALKVVNVRGYKETWNEHFYCEDFDVKFYEGMKWNEIQNEKIDIVGKNGRKINANVYRNWIAEIGGLEEMDDMCNVPAVHKNGYVVSGEAVIDENADYYVDWFCQD